MLRLTPRPVLTDEQVDAAYRWADDAYRDAFARPHARPDDPDHHAV